MHPRDHGEPYEPSPETTGPGFVRRGRRFTPPGAQSSRDRYRRPRRSQPALDSVVQLGDVVAELTPRQAVVWLLNLDTMVSLYESTTEQKLSEESLDRLVSELRRIIRRH